MLYPRWGLEIEYLSDAWFERIRYIVQQAAARRIEIWLYDEFCWPSGHAKGLVTKGRADLAAQLLYVERDGSSRIEQAGKAANLLMPEATERFLTVTHERYAVASGILRQHGPGDLHRRTIALVAASAANTRRPLVAAHVVRRARKPWAAISASDWPLPARMRPTLRIWSEYWAGFARLYHDAWIQPIARWCEAHWIAMSGHLLGENSFSSHVANYGSLRRQLAEFHIPGIDEINTRFEVNTCEAMTLAAIAEYLKERMLEVFALGPCYMKMETMRRMVDLCSAYRSGPLRDGHLPV